MTVSSARIIPKGEVVGIGGGCVGVGEGPSGVLVGVSVGVLVGMGVGVGRGRRQKLTALLVPGERFQLPEPVFVQ